MPRTGRQRPNIYFVLYHTLPLLILFPSHPSAILLHPPRLPGPLDLATLPISLSVKAGVLAMSWLSGPPLISSLTASYLSLSLPPSLLFLKYASHAPSSGPLHLLLPLSGNALPHLLGSSLKHQPLGEALPGPVQNCNSFSSLRSSPELPIPFPCSAFLSALIILWQMTYFTGLFIVLSLPSVM